MSNKLIIGVSGKKQSGKNTLCNCLYDLFTEIYAVDDVMMVSFADALKEKVCQDVLGLTKEQVNGTDAQKNSLTKYKWDTLPREIRYKNNLGYKYADNGEICEVILPTGYMSAREIMQIVGTDIFRNYFDDNIWVNTVLRVIEQSNKRVFLISDVRFPSEVNLVLNNDGWIIRLLRDVCDTDAHSSETSLDDFNFLQKHCVVFDNTDMTIEQQNEKTKIMVSELFALAKGRNRKTL